MWTPSRNTVTLGLVSVLSLGVGSVSGYFLARRTLAAKFEEDLEREIESTKVFYQSFYKVGDHSDPEKLAEKLLGEDFQQYNTQSDEVPPEILERIVRGMRAAEKEVAEEAKHMPEEGLHNAFENPLPEWDQEEQSLERRNGQPYIISHEEFYQNEWDFTEGQLVYYTGDDVLADSRDEPIHDKKSAIGDVALDDNFGFGSQDPNILFVCNEQLEMIFEVARSSKSYAEDVLGFVEGGELKHGQRKFRQERDG